jgi:hypothetical protein
MNKQTKMYLGLGVVAIAAYYFWMKSKTPATKADFKGSSHPDDGTVCTFKSKKTRKITYGKYYYQKNACVAKNGDKGQVLSYINPTYVQQGYIHF